MNTGLPHRKLVHALSYIAYAGHWREWRDKAMRL
jgi:hypothetical protein